jgi:hypothetical protein
MKGTLLLVATLLLAACPTVHAGGIGVNWGSLCYTLAPTDAQRFACGSSTTPAEWTVTTSFMLDLDMPDFYGLEVAMVGWALGDPIPDWWKLGAADCRSRSVSWSCDKSPVSDETCVDWAGGREYDAFGVRWEGNYIYLDAGGALPQDQPAELMAGIEYYAGSFRIRNGKTVGEGACGGCSTHVQLGLLRITVFGVDGRRDDLSWTLPAAPQILEWNDRPVAAKGTTWGQLKSLYR